MLLAEKEVGQGKVGCSLLCVLLHREVLGSRHRSKCWSFGSKAVSEAAAALGANSPPTVSSQMLLEPLDLAAL